MNKESTRAIFPPNQITQMYIDFCRLRPKISDTIPGEHIKLNAEVSVSNAKENSMFNVVTKCSYMNTRDPNKEVEEWKIREKQLREKFPSITQDEVEFEKRNFELLDAQRYFRPDSFDYIIQSVGVYDNNDIVVKACVVLQNKFVDFIQALLENNNDKLYIKTSETTLENCYDIVLENEDYTAGKILEYNLYNLFFEKDKQLSFCGFKKNHPHYTYSIARIAFLEPVEMDQIKYVIKEACVKAQDKITEIYHLFHS
jgi:DNA-directed RNA polymerase subunit L